MQPDQLIQPLRDTQTFFDRATSIFDEEDADFAPSEEMMTTTQQVAHVAQTIDWFMEGAFRPEGFSMDFETMIQEVLAVASLAEARAWLQRAFDGACDLLATKSSEELTAALPPGPIMGGEPRHAIVGAISDHTAHHRGALTVYARLRGKTAPMPYGDF